MQLTIDLRPRKLSEVYGHPNIIKSIQNRAKEDSWPTATLLKGFSGSGKSTIAGILATMMNCEHREDNGDPCLKCPSCLSVTSERFDRDIKRLDGGQSGKDDVIDFMQYVNSTPFYDRNKNIFIVEEVDQLSSKAMNSLLKVLETPSENTHFILLSMNHKGIDLPNTSRCQTYSFSPFFKKDILLGLQSDLKRIGKWGIPEIPKSFYTEVLPAIASASQGSYRKALQDTEACLFGEAWTSEQYVDLTGSLDGDTVVDTLYELLSKKKRFFLTLERLNFQEFFNVAYDLMSKAYAYKKTGVINNDFSEEQIKNDFFEEQIKDLSSNERLEAIIQVFNEIYEINPSYIKKSHAIFKLASLY